MSTMPFHRRIGRFNLGKTLGQGGSATVFLAEDTLLGVKRAVKLVIAPNEDAREALRRRLRVEARAMAQIGHPNILRVYDVLQEGQDDIVVMELAEGGSLSGWLEANGPMPAPLAISYLIQVLSALSAAHAAGIVHRDVKPQNILLDRSGTALLADFGIALITSADAVRTTRVGSAMGSLSYMPPEQRLDARSVGVAADIYACGSTLYNLLTAQSPIDLFMAEAESERWNGIPPRICDVLLRALSRDPAARYPTARAMALALHAILQEEVAEAVERRDPLDPRLFPEPSSTLSPGGGLTGRGRLSTIPGIEATNHAITLLEDAPETLRSQAAGALTITLLEEGPLQGKAPEQSVAPSERTPVTPATLVPDLPPPSPPPPRSSSPVTPPVARWVAPVGLALLLAAITLGAWWAEQREGPDTVLSPPASPPASPEASVAPAASDLAQAPLEASDPEGVQIKPKVSEPVSAPPARVSATTPSAAGGATVAKATASSAAPEAAVAQEAPLGRWSATFNGRPATFTLHGSPGAVRGDVSVRLALGAEPVTTQVEGKYDAEARVLSLADQIEGPDAGTYTLTLEDSLDRFSGKFVTRLSGRTVIVSGWRSP